MKIDLKKVNINKRMLFLVLLLIMTLIGVWFYKKSYKIKKMKIHNLQSEVERIQNEIEITQTEIPNLEEITAKLQDNKKKKNDLEKQEAKYEEGIPTESDFDVFLGCLTVFEKDKKLDFMSIKPIAQPEEAGKEGKKKLPYKEKEFSIKIKGSLDSILDYVYYVHGISDSSSVSTASIVLMDDGESRYLQSSLKLKALFSETGKRQRKEKFQPRLNGEFPETIKTNVFSRTLFSEDATDVEKSASDETPDIRIDGIIQMGEKSRVIIGGDIYKSGDAVGNLMIDSIGEKEVVFSGSQGKVVVNIEENE
ncbi:MAG: hypothetical protein JW928_00865 [Candidatus Aureabacteria bacterium]|nr:hypothetical protein [Candidatus Auribacterota bacterium]